MVSEQLQSLGVSRLDIIREDFNRIHDRMISMLTKMIEAKSTSKGEFRMLENWPTIEEGSVVNWKSGSVICNPGDSSNENDVHARGEFKGNGRLPKIDFPPFAGEDPREWLRKAMKYFQLHQTPDELKLGIAKKYLEGRAYIWFYGFIASHPNADWGMLSEELCKRFAENTVEEMCIDDEVEEIASSSVGEYTLDGKYNFKIIGNDDYEIEKDALSSVQEKMQFGISSVSSWYEQASVQNYGNEEVTCLGKKVSVQNTLEGSLLTLSDHKMSIVTEHLADEICKRKKEMQPAQETPVNMNSRDFILNAIRGNDILIVASDGQYVTLHYLLNPKVVQRMSQAEMISVLIDNGSTHNFLNEKMMQKLSCKILTTKQVIVTVSDGEKLMSTAICNPLVWTMQGMEFQYQQRGIRFGDSDMVLGIDWQSQLDPVLFDLSWGRFKFNFEREVKELNSKSSKRIFEIIASSEVSQWFQKQLYVVIAQLNSLAEEETELVSNVVLTLIEQILTRMSIQKLLVKYYGHLPVVIEGNNDLADVGGMLLQTCDYIFHEPSKDYSGRVAGTIPKEDSTSLVFDKLRQMDKRLENQQICPSEVLANNEPGKPVADPKKEGLWENILQQDAGMDGPSYWVADMPNDSNSVVSNHDPWILCHDTKFSPPRHSKIQVKREVGGTRGIPGDSNPINGELQTDNCKELNIEVPLEEQNQPLCILSTLMVKGSNQAITLWLVQWVGTNMEDATWETSQFMQTKFSSFEPWGQGYSKGEGLS